jgi:tetratricopeptide (TPR) repeat protein
MNLLFRRVTLGATMMIALVANDALSFSMVDPEWEDRIRNAIYLVADSQYDEGLSIVEQYIKAHRSDPAGYFLYAVGVQEIIQKKNDLSEVPRFEKYADLCTRKALQVMRRDPKDGVARLVYGAIHGYAGLVEARKDSLLAAFLSARTAVQYLEELIAERQDIDDAYFGLGMIYYFASRKTAEEGGMTAWVIESFITHGKDMRQEGIAHINRAINANPYARDYARSALMWINLYDHHYERAHDMALEISKRFPRDTISRWVLGRTALVRGDCDEATARFLEIEQINDSRGRSVTDFPDVVAGRDMANLCTLIRDDEIVKAQMVHRRLVTWIENEPKIAIEYQDAKNLVTFWRQELHKSDVKIRSIRPLSRPKEPRTMETQP